MNFQNLARALWQAVGKNARKNPNPLVNQQLKPEEGADPGSHPRHALICHGRGCGGSVL